MQALLNDARSVDTLDKKVQPAEPLCVSPQGERGPPGVNGTQGFQGCPGQRGVKVECGRPSVWGVPLQPRTCAEGGSPSQHLLGQEDACPASPLSAGQPAASHGGGPGPGRFRSTGRVGKGT